MLFLFAELLDGITQLGNQGCRGHSPAKVELPLFVANFAHVCKEIENPTLLSS